MSTRPINKSLDLSPVEQLVKDWNNGGNIAKALDGVFSDLAFLYIGTEEAERANQHLFFIKELRDAFTKMDAIHQPIHNNAA